MVMNPKRSRRRKGRKGHRKHSRNFFLPSGNPRRKHRRSRRHNPAASMRRPLGALTSGFKIGVIKDAGIMAGGAFANNYVRNLVAGYLPATFQSGLANNALGLATSGLMLFIPKVGPKMATGGVLLEALRVLNPYVQKAKIALGEYLTVQEARGMKGLNDYLTTSTPLSDYDDESLQGMDEYLTVKQAQDADLSAAASTFE